MMVAALSFTACGDGDDESKGDGGGNNSRPYTVIVDNGKPYEIDQFFQSPGSGFGLYSSQKHYLGLQVIPMYAYFQMYFSPNTNPSQLFKVGYNRFEKDAIDIRWDGTSGRDIKLTYVSGSAKVIKNTVEEGLTCFTIEFDNYKFTWNSGRTIIFDGILKCSID